MSLEGLTVTLHEADLEVQGGALTACQAGCGYTLAVANVTKLKPVWPRPVASEVEDAAKID